MVIYYILSYLGYFDALPFNGSKDGTETTLVVVVGYGVVVVDFCNWPGFAPIDMIPSSTEI